MGGLERKYSAVFLLRNTAACFLPPPFAGGGDQYIMATKSPRWGGSISRGWKVPYEILFSTPVT